MIDTQLYAQGIRYPVYQWFDEIGKAELFFDGLSDEQVLTWYVQEYTFSLGL